MEYAYGNWFLVIILSGLFIWFAYDSFRPKNKIDWMTFGTFSAFVIALFTEMYGFPLTIYLLSSWFGNRFPQINFSHNSGHLWQDLFGIQGDPHFTFLHIVSYIFIIAGLILLGNSWKVLYSAKKHNRFAINGPYKYIRHPQYTSFLLIILGFLTQWPTIPTLIMAPILAIMYIGLAKKEEHEMIAKFTGYSSYEKRTPAFIPSLRGLFNLTKQTLWNTQ